jgi:hypothetical protein
MPPVSLQEASSRDNTAAPARLRNGRMVHSPTLARPEGVKRLKASPLIE